MGETAHVGIPLAVRSMRCMGVEESKEDPSVAEIGASNGETARWDG